MSYQNESAQIRPIGGLSSIYDRLRTVSAISKVVCLVRYSKRMFYHKLYTIGNHFALYRWFQQVCEMIGFICSECVIDTTKSSNFYSTVAMIAFICTAIFLSLELYWPYTDAQRIIETKDVDLYLSAIGALMFMLISTLATYHSYDNNSNAAAVSIWRKIYFWIQKCFTVISFGSF